MNPFSAPPDALTLFRNIVEGTPNGIVVYQPVHDATGAVVDYRTTYHNPRAGHLLGYSDEEFARTTLFERFPPGQALAEQYLPQVGQQHPVIHEQFNDKTGYWIESQVCWMDVGFFVVLRDVTDRKRYEEQILRQNFLLDGMLNTFLSGITAYEAVKDEAGELIDFRVTFVNEGSLQQTNGVIATRDQVVGRTVTELYPRTREEGMWYHYQQVYQSGQSLRHEHYYPALNRWMDVSVQKSGDGLLVTYNDITARKQTELAYQQQAELLRNVMDASPAGISLMNAQRDAEGQLIDFRLVLTNQATAFMTGRTATDIQGKSVLETFPAYRPLGIYDRYRTVLETGQPARFDVHYQGDGLENWFDIAAYRQGDGVVGTFLDVTPIRRAEQAAQQQADLLTQISQSMQMAVSAHAPVHDDEGRIVDFRYTYFNEKAKEWLPVNGQSVLDQTVKTMPFSTNVDQIIARMIGVMETGIPTSFDAALPDGRIFYNIVARSGDGTVTTFIDVTEQRRHQQRIAELKAVAEQQKDLLQGVLDGSQNAIIAFEAVRSERGEGRSRRITDFRYVLQNEANRQRIGRPDDVLLGRTMLEFFPEVATNGLLEQYIQVVETGETLRFELEFTYQHEPGWYDYSVVKRGDGIVMTVHDKTAERHARQLVEQANAELQRSNDNLQSFAYVASHDLQEPLRKIKSFGDVVLAEYGSMLPQHGQDMLVRMQGAAERMSLLIRDILALSRLTTQKRVFTPVNLNLVVVEVLGDLETVVAEKQADVEIAPLPTVHGDALQLRQLFQNLLTNALKFAQPGQPPRIQVSCQRLPTKELPVGLLSSITMATDNKPMSGPADRYQQYYALTVRDNGIGFDAIKHGEIIFGAFQRLHGRTGNYSGTGIGLAIVKSVVENHGGVITVHSQEGEGATFTVYLPVVR